jgi:hypothetical protein
MSSLLINFRDNLREDVEGSAGIFEVTNTYTKDLQNSVKGIRGIRTWLHIIFGTNRLVISVFLWPHVRCWTCRFIVLTQHHARTI